MENQVRVDSTLRVIISVSINSYVASDYILSNGMATVSVPGVVYDASNYVELAAGFECFIDFEIKLDGYVP